jgi:hypothetical protein
MNLTYYLLLITHYFAREVRALGEFNLPSSIPSLLVRNAGNTVRRGARPCAPKAWSIIDLNSQKSPHPHSHSPTDPRRIQHRFQVQR